MFSKVLLATLGASAAHAIPSWTIDDYDFDTIILSVAFSDTNNGIIPVDDNGTGPSVKVTSDGGSTWNDVPGDKFSSLLMDSATKGKNAVMGGVLDNQYSTDNGNTWTPTQGPTVISQSCEALRDPTDDQTFGWTGSDVRGDNGVGLSKDGGQTLKFYNISEAKTYARYGAFPSKNVWYVSAGEWPQTLEQDPTVLRELTHRIRLHNHSGKVTRSYLDGAPLRITEDGWKAQILKTADAGQTWTSSFYNEGEFYFNGIDCADETHCCAVGESDSGDRPGCRIWCTTDGASWTEQYFLSGADESLMAMRALGNNEWWAAGGRLNQLDFEGHFIHSMDGGSTWDANATVMKVYGTALSFPDNAHGWAAVLQRDEQSGLAKYSN
jgi:photosystem II stability/assembly factor-like uncharacterized protein